MVMTDGSPIVVHSCLTAHHVSTERAPFSSENPAVVRCGWAVVEGTLVSIYVYTVHIFVHLCTSVNLNPHVCLHRLNVHVYAYACMHGCVA